MIHSFKLWTFSLAFVTTGYCADNLHKCNLPLGLQNGKIPDSSIKSSVGSNAGKARLNSDGAWCFTGSKVEKGQDVTLTIDFGVEKFVTAVQTQGPPLNLKNREYNYHIGFYIENSTETTTTVTKWGTCCEGKKVLFYSEDTLNEYEKVNLHSFGTMVLARKLRLRFETNVRWAGEDEKCFRLEILGCSEDLVPTANLIMKPLPSGWVEATWNKPMVYIPNVTISNNYYIPIQSYYVNLTWAEGKGTQKMVNSTFLTVDAPRLMVPGPIWGATYALSLICPHQGVNMSCGSTSIIATVNGCNPRTKLCTSQIEVVFRRPQKIKSWVIRPTSSNDSYSNVFVSWSSEGPGWVTTSTKISVKDDTGKMVIEKLIDEEGHCMTLMELKGPIFELTFNPQANSLKFTPSFTYDLHVIAWKTLNAASTRGGFGAFVTDVTLEANIHWEGKMIVTWSPALVREGDLVNTTDDATNVTKYEINGNTEFTGQANIYNVSLMETNDYTSLESLTVQGSTELKAEFLLLKLESNYQINISCDYGGIVVQCGLITIYTALPVKLTELDSQLLVYVGHAGGQSWHSQEANCKKGSGTLATFGTEEEELLLRPALMTTSSGVNYKYFWIGLNMCQDNNGTLWSDGSQWVYNLLPQVDAGLSSGTCCIKAEYSEVRKSFSWTGEACNALLPGICEYKPRGLVGDVLDVKRTGATTTTISYEWEYKSNYWTPASFTSTTCMTMDLATFLPHKRSCSATSINSDQREFQSKNLALFTEFNVSVCAALPNLNFNGVNQSILARTMPHIPVFLNVRGSGHLNVMWAQKVAEFDEDEEIDATLYEGPSMVPVLTQKAPARNVTFGNLLLGQIYRIKLLEKSSKKREETRDFYAYPPCKCTDCQDETRCITPSDKQVSKSLAMQQCKDEGATVAISITKDRLKVLLRQAEKVFDDLWVSSSSLKGNVTRAAALARDGDNPDAELLPPVTPPTYQPRSNSEECLLVSRSQKAIIVASDCRETHYAACEQKAPLSPVFPHPSAIKTLVGGTWLSFTWDTSFSAWKANYTIYYQKVSDKRSKRDLKYQAFENPPVLISDLAKNTDYSIQLVADLGRGFLSTAPEFERITSDSNTRSSGVSTGFNTASDDNSPKWMSAGWSPSPEFFLAHLICGALIITACISTMLLFFATGMFYQDCIAQLGFLFCILTAYLLLLVAHPHYVEEQENGCIVLSAILHLLFTSAFLFLALEALTMTHLLSERIKSPFEKSNWPLVLFATLVPLVYVIICAAIIQVGYSNADRDNCWVNISSPVLLVQCIPNGLIFLATIALILATLKSNEDNQPLLKDNEIRGRQSDSYRLRWVILALSIELAIVWSSGIAAYHLHSRDAHSIFNTFTLILAMTIIFARTWLDDTFRSKIHRLCCGTELTYKRSAMRSISARTRVAPTNFNKDQRASSGFSTTTIRASQKSAAVPQYSLPNSPPPDHNNSTVLIKRTYKFDDES